MNAANAPPRESQQPRFACLVDQGFGREPNYRSPVAQEIPLAQNREHLRQGLRPPGKYRGVRAPCDGR